MAVKVVERLETYTNQECASELPKPVWAKTLSYVIYAKSTRLRWIIIACYSTVRRRIDYLQILHYSALRISRSLTYQTFSGSKP